MRKGLKIPDIGEFIPIFIIVGFALSPDQMILFSESILGKIVAIGIIVYYLSIDFVYGLFACSLILFYYHMNLTTMVTPNLHRYQPRQDTIYGTIWKESFESLKPYQPISSNQYSMIEFDNIEDNRDENILLNRAKSEELMDMFRQENCKNGQLFKKEMPVRTEFAPHVFSEIKYKGPTCNPCDPSCKFSIIEERFKTESDLVFPKSSRDENTEKTEGAFEPVVSLFKNTFNQFFVYK